MTQDAQGRWRDRNGRYMRVETTTLREGHKGRNKRGTCLHKRTRGVTKKPKRQVLPREPQPVTAYRMTLAKSKGRKV